FFPELTPQAAPVDADAPISADNRASHLLKQRRSYQGGLLGFLRGDEKGARMMREAVGGIEHACEPQSPARTFWWSVGAFFDALASRLDQMQTAESVSELFAMEYATGILLAESAVENFSSLPSNFPKQVEAMLARLDATQAGRPVPPATSALIDDIFRRAQER